MPVADTLVGSSVIMKIAVAMNHMSKPTVTDEPDAVEAFAFQRAEETLDVRIAIGRMWRDANIRDTSGGQDTIEAGFAKLTAAIMDKMGDAVPGKEAGVGHGQVAGDLLHDDGVGICGHGADMHFSGGDDHDYADVKRAPSGKGQHRDAGEVNAGEGRPVSGEKNPPGLLVHATIRDGFDAVGFEYAFDRSGRNSDVHAGEHANDFAITPGILTGKSDHQPLDVVGDRWSATASSRWFLNRDIRGQLAEPSAQRRCRRQSQQMLGCALPPERLRQFSELPFIRVTEVPQGIRQQTQQDADEGGLKHDDRPQA